MDWPDIFGILGFFFALVGITMADFNPTNLVLSRISFLVAGMSIIFNDFYRYWYVANSPIFIPLYILSWLLLCYALWFINKKQYGLYPHLFVVQKDLDEKTDDFSLWLETSGSISNIHYHIHPEFSVYGDNEYRSILNDTGFVFTHHGEGPIITNTKVSEGFYTVDFTTANGVFSETLIIARNHSKLHQIIRIYNRNNKLLYSNTRKR